MRQIARAIGAFAAAALAIGVAAAIMVLPFEPRGAWLAGKLAAEIALAVALVLGVPAHAILRRLDKTSWRYYGIAGAMLAMAVTLLFAWLGFNELPGLLAIAGLSLVFGLVGSLTFWIIARPDLSAPQRP